MDQQQHEMILELTHPSGADEWYCPTCGRRLIMEYQPSYKKTILNSGDEYAVHSGGKGGLRIGSTQVTSISDYSSQEEPMIALDDQRLAPWVAWLDEVGFDNLWKDDA